jgi:hypothetical protein
MSQAETELPTASRMWGLLRGSLKSWNVLGKQRDQIPVESARIVGEVSSLAHF